MSALAQKRNTTPFHNQSSLIGNTSGMNTTVIRETSKKSVNFSPNLKQIKIEHKSKQPTTRKNKYPSGDQSKTTNLMYENYKNSSTTTISKRQVNENSQKIRNNSQIYSNTLNNHRQNKSILNDKGNLFNDPNNAYKNIKYQSTKATITNKDDKDLFKKKFSDQTLGPVQKPEYQSEMGNRKNQIRPKSSYHQNHKHLASELFQKQEFELKQKISPDLDKFNLDSFKSIYQHLVDHDRFVKQAKVIRPKSSMKFQSRESVASTQESSNVKRQKSSMASQLQIINQTFHNNNHENITSFSNKYAIIGSNQNQDVFGTGIYDIKFLEESQSEIKNQEKQEMTAQDQIKGKVNKNPKKQCKDRNLSKNERNYYSQLNTGGVRSIESSPDNRNLNNSQFFESTNHQFNNQKDLKNSLAKATKKDHLFVVLWKLHKISQQEINPGETTAYKHFNNASEAKRFKKTLHQLKWVKQNLMNSNYDQTDKLEGLKKFIIKALNHSVQKYSKYFTQDKLEELQTHIIELDLHQIDPKYSLSQIIKRLLKNLDILQDPTAAFKDFHAHLQKVELKRLQMDEIESHSKPQQNSQRIQQVCPEYKYYDVSDVFMNNCYDSPNKNPAKLIEIFDKANEKMQKSCENLNRLQTYIKQNKQITQPQVPQPYLMREFPFVSKVGMGLGSYKQSQYGTMLQSAKGKKQRRKVKSRGKSYTNQHVSIADNDFEDNQNCDGLYKARNQSAVSIDNPKLNKDLEHERQKLINRDQLKPQQVGNTAYEINKVINKLSIKGFEQSSVLQRNRLMLEHVIVQRQKDNQQQYTNQNYQNDAKSKEISQFSQQNQNNLKSMKQRRPPSQIGRSMLSSHKNSIIVEKYPIKEEDNNMVFIKNEKLIYF
eukprot:403350035